jgi:hypothetical protein
MKKSEIRNYAVDRIFEGKSRQETYLELKEDGVAKPEEIAEVVRYLPSLEMRKKNKIPYLALLVLLGLTVLFRILGVIGFLIEDLIALAVGYSLTTLIPIYFLYALGTYRMKVLNVIVYLGVLGFLRIAIDLRFNNGILEIIDLVIVGLIAFLAFYLKSKMASPFEVVTEPYLDQQGNKKIKRLIVFKD